MQLQIYLEVLQEIHRLTLINKKIFIHNLSIAIKFQEELALLGERKYILQKLLRIFTTLLKDYGDQIKNIKKAIASNFSVQLTFCKHTESMITSQIIIKLSLTKLATNIDLKVNILHFLEIQQLQQLSITLIALNNNNNENSSNKPFKLNHGSLMS